MSLLRLFTASDYFFGIFWSLYCPYFVYLRLLITSLVYIGHCIVCTSSIYGFWLLLRYILVIVLSVLRLFMASDYSFGIFWSLYCPYFVYLRLLITSLVYFGHCIVRTSSVYLRFWLLHWYILIIALSVLRLFTAFDYFFGIFWSLYCPYFVYLRLLITPLVYFGHCIVLTSSIYGFWLLLWYILVTLLSVLRLFTASDYSIGIFWSLYCPYFVYLRLLITPLVYFSRCIVLTSSIYGFWLLLWYILVVVLSLLRLFTASDYFFGIYWSLYCVYFVYLRLLITSLVYFGHCIVRTSSIYGFWLLLWYILIIALSVLRLFTAFDYFFGIFWSLYCPYFVYLRFWLLHWYILVIVLSVLRLFTASDHSIGIFWSLYCSYFVYLRLLITPLVNFSRCIVLTSSIYGFWLLLWYILVVVLSLLRLFTASDYFFCIYWSLYCVYFVYLRLLITSTVYFGHCIVRTSSIYGFWSSIIVRTSSIYASDYSFGIFWSLYCPYFVYLRLLITSLVYFGHCIVRTSSIYGFWLLHWYILVIVLSVLRLFTASDYSFGIFWSLYCPYFVYLRLLITSLVYFGHCIVLTSSIYGFWLLLWYILVIVLSCTSSIYGFWLLLRYILVIVLSVLRLFMASDYSFGIFWSLHCPYFVYLRLLITSLVYFGHCIVRTSSIYGFWLLHWYILVIVLSVLRLFTASDYFFGIFWSLYCPYFVYLRLLITPLVYFGHCIVLTSSIYGFWLPLWYIVVVLSLLRLFTASDYPFGIFWSLYCPYSSIYGFWLLLWYILVVVLSLLRLFTASDYFFCIFWSLYCPYFVYLRLLITSLVYFSRCIVLTSSIYGFWLLHWYILVIVLFVLRLFTASDYFFGIFWSLLRLFTASDYPFGIF